MSHKETIDKLNADSDFQLELSKMIHELLLVTMERLSVFLSNYTQDNARTSYVFLNVTSAIPVFCLGQLAGNWYGEDYTDDQFKRFIDELVIMVRKKSKKHKPPFLHLLQSPPKKTAPNNVH